MGSKKKTTFAKMNREAKVLERRQATKMRKEQRQRDRDAGITHEHQEEDLSHLDVAVVEGVEPGCLLLDAAGRQYLLVGGDRAELRAGSRVLVTGRSDPNLLSTCQQGEPLVVASIEPAR